MAQKRPTLVVLVGPTASGKTAAAIALARKINGVVVSADSRQLYAGMDIGTAKPRLDQHKSAKSGEALHGFTPVASPLTGGSAETPHRRPHAHSLPAVASWCWGDQQPHDVLTADTVDGIEHYLINIRYPSHAMSLAEWQAAAYQVIDAAINRGKVPILVGGTMLYVDSIVRGYDIPAVPKNDRLRAELARVEVERLYERLLRLDARAAEFVSAKNARRIIRALEVIDATGRPFSAMRRKRAGRYAVKVYGMFPGWDRLEQTITVRASQMLADGLMQEKEELIDKYGVDLPLLRTINYQQAPDKKEMIRANMRYARRQMSWWKNRPKIHWRQTAEMEPTGLRPWYPPQRGIPPTGGMAESRVAAKH